MSQEAITLTMIYLIAYVVISFVFWLTHVVNGTGFFAWYDCWVGWFWDSKRRVLYVCLLPCLVIRWQ